MITVTREYYPLCCAHFLPNVPKEHRCYREHGHNYRLLVTITGPLDSRGFILDYAEIDDLVQPLIARIDHKRLNDVEGLENPTVENIATWFYEFLMARINEATLPNYASLVQVQVYETDDSWATVSS